MHFDHLFVLFQANEKPQEEVHGSSTHGSPDAPGSSGVANGDDDDLDDIDDDLDDDELEEL